MERAFEPGSGEPGVVNDAGRPAGAWDDWPLFGLSIHDPAHEQPPRGVLTPLTEYAPGTGGRDSAACWPLSSCCQGSGTLDRYERPYALCEHHRALPEHVYTTECLTQRRLCQPALAPLIILCISSADPLGLMISWLSG